MKFKTSWEEQRAVMGFLEIAETSLSSARAIVPNDIYDEELMNDPIWKAFQDRLYETKEALDKLMRVAQEIPTKEQSR